MSSFTDLDPAYVEQVTPREDAPFVAWMCDRLGFIYSDEDVAAWCDDPDNTCDDLGLEDDGFETVRVVTATAAELRPAGARYRAPGSHVTVDVWSEWDLFGMDPGDVRERWRQAKLVAQLLNTAHASGTPVVRED